MFFLGTWLLGVVFGYIARRKFIRYYANLYSVGPMLRWLGETVYFKHSLVRWVIWLWPVSIPLLLLGLLLYWFYLLSITYL